MFGASAVYAAVINGARVGAHCGGDPAGSGYTGRGRCDWSTYVGCRLGAPKSEKICATTVKLQAYELSVAWFGALAAERLRGIVHP